MDTSTIRIYFDQDQLKVEMDYTPFIHQNQERQFPLGTLSLICLNHQSK